jgi:hypothetical protein
MPANIKSKSKAKKSASRKSAGENILKKAVKKKTAPKKKALKKKVAKKKVAITKKALPKKVATKPKPSRKQAVPPKTFMVEPGPPPQGIPSVEEPVQHEEALGTVSHYYSHLGVAIVQINKGSLKTGDSIRIAGNSTDFTQKVESMEYEHQHIDLASAGQSVGLRVNDHARQHDIVYLVK